MENIINTIITLDNEEKYMVLNQAIYQNKNYYFVVKVAADEENIMDEFRLLEEVEVDGQKAIVTVTDKKIIELLTKYFSPRDEQ